MPYKKIKKKLLFLPLVKFDLWVLHMLNIALKNNLKNHHLFYNTALNARSIFRMCIMVTA